MSLAIEHYALIGDRRTAALVGRDGSVDWLCLPRFDSEACFAALLGTRSHGHWQLVPTEPVLAVRRRYREGSLVLETEFETASGLVRLVDFMPVDDAYPGLVRIVRCLSGSVAMRMELVMRFDYGSIVPWVRQQQGRLVATAGPDTLELQHPVPVRGENLSTLAEFTLTEGQSAPFSLRYRASHQVLPLLPDAFRSLESTLFAWQEWSSRCTYSGPWREAVVRSITILKALSYQPTGGIVAAPTTSLPERVGGVRNWDYRYCWLRDATFTLNALLLAGYRDEAIAWREWLLRAIAGNPENLQICYSVTGKRRLDERELPWLPGYGQSAPVRVGNAAARQFQLDVYGEVMDTLHLARAAGLPPDLDAWDIQIAMLKFLEAHWQDPDEGIWEVRGPRRQFTHSKVMAWVAFDRAIKDAEVYGLEGPVARWRRIRDVIHRKVCDSGWDAKRGSFTQCYGSPNLDAALLLMPQVGFLPPDDERVRGTIRAIEEELLVDGLVMRYSTATGVDALPPGEGAFLPCSFWLVDCLVMTGRGDEARALFERLLALRNDLGLLAEEYDPTHRRHLGNFPQALTHTALINSARLLSRSDTGLANPGSGERPSAAVVAPAAVVAGPPPARPSRESRWPPAIARGN